ncbi:MAG: sodium:calcium antiporter [Saprospiraceae bacterium]|nr:MAG: sodium:calcium antiporter [Saprospiraceae bacterium]
MEILLYIGLFIISLGVLLKASDWFVDGAEAIGLSLGISPFIIGLTIVAFGTSLPELATSIAAVLSGNSEIVVGNVIGSNITNIALVLGLVAVFNKQIDLEYNIWHIDMPFLWGSAFMLWFVLKDFYLSLFEMLLLLTGICVFLTYSFKGDDPGSKVEKQPTTWRSYFKLLLGGVLVWMSADYTILAISELSAQAGIDPEIIALSAVALGTSLPEVIVSLNAARKGNTALAVGNVLGSNVFNTYVVMSIPAIFGSLTIPVTILDYFLPLMIVMTILFGIMASNKKITRWEGCVLLLFYALYLGEIITETVG